MKSRRCGTVDHTAGLRSRRSTANESRTSPPEIVRVHRTLFQRAGDTLVELLRVEPDEGAVDARPQHFAAGKDPYLAALRLRSGREGHLAGAGDGERGHAAGGL